MLRQYLDIKSRYQDSILFFRMGDFYEMFFEDATVAAPILEIALTTRDRGKENPVPMCGIPYHAAQTYITKLLKNGRKVAICEQVEDPALAKGIVRREVVRVVTPGLVTDIAEVDAREHNYIVGLLHRDGLWGVAFLDFSTGDVSLTEIEDLSDLVNEILKLGPSEAVMPDGYEGATFSDFIRLSLSGTLINYIDSSPFEREKASQLMCETFGIISIDGLGLSDKPLALGALGGLIRYVVDNEKGGVTHLSLPRFYAVSDFLLIDEMSKRNLELTKTIYEGTKSGSLLSLLDQTASPMGGRLLREWINYPLVDIDEIGLRLEAVGTFYENASEAEEISERFRSCADIERIAARVATKSVTPRELIALSDSLKIIPDLLSRLVSFEFSLRESISRSFEDFSQLIGKIDATLVDSPSQNVRDGGIIRDGVNKDLDELRGISRTGKDYILDLEATEKKNTKIPNLKVRFNRVFGYYIEITNSYLNMVPPQYIRKQTLVGAERFITPELKEFEAKVLGAQERIKVLEHDIYAELCQFVGGWIGSIKRAAKAIALIDVLVNFALVARDRRFVRPRMSDTDCIHIKAGRHPMVERFLPRGTFVPNDVYLDGESSQLLIITGPNMAGKSTIIRQVAIIVLMAQMGCFVPADSAEIGVVDRIFTRVGASDFIVRGQSTFMVEMLETANILNNATAKSLVILDEIGRGTSTFDGVSIAWAVSEYLHDHPRVRPRTLFATHYHELTELAAIKSRVKNYNIAVKEWNDRIIFLRKMEKGASSHSYGIEVARLAGIPRDVIDRAREILQNLERGEFNAQGIPIRATGTASQGKWQQDQFELFSNESGKIIEEIAGLDLYQMTPLEAMKKIEELKEKIKKMS